MLRYGVDGKAPDVAALGTPDYSYVLRPGDMLYVPRGAIHHTSTRVDGEDPNDTEPSLHFTAALPMDHQSLTWAMGVAPGPGVAQHTYLMAGLQKAMEALIANDVSLRRSLKPFGNESAMEDTVRSALHLAGA
jgi:hypothetical protein